MENIALIGFMGTGKTSVGINLAQELGWDFIDTDEVIKRKIGLEISDIFQYYGESFFRQQEKKVIELACRLTRHVISTGGGTIINVDNLKQLKEHSFLICLVASPEEILERVKCDNSRPLLAVEDPLKIIKNLLKIREPYYQCADLFIDTSNKTLEKIIEEIMAHIRQRGITRCRL
jgi:shikimate kinase